MRAINWNEQGNEITETFWKQNIAQFWTEEEFKVSKDLTDWDEMTNEEQTTFVEALSGLTGLDTEQGDEGMTLILYHHDDLHEKAVFAWMAMMEHIHAKSYSHIFTTLLPSSKTDYYLTEWIHREDLQQKYKVIGARYRALLNGAPSEYDRYMALVASVFLESFLFYSGFFYPLYLSGQGSMVASGEIIRKIMMDEAIHGAFGGMVAQRIYREQLSKCEREKSNDDMHTMLMKLYDLEYDYTKSVYDRIGLTEKVDNYVRYNANRALKNLGFEAYFDHHPVNPIVENGLDTHTTNHDFFSTKGDSYTKALNVEPLADDDFDFSDVKESWNKR